MSKHEVIISETDKFTNEFCEFFYSSITQFIGKKGKINIGLSGGNTPKKIFEHLKKEYSNKIAWSKVNFFWGDERMVPWHSNESNYGEAKRLLFDHIEIPKENIFPIIGENNPDQEASRYESILKNNLPIKNNLPVLDINILGLGDDGHTASIFPDQMELLYTDHICRVAKHPTSGQKRITITGNTLNNADLTIFLLNGENKARVISQIIKNSEITETFPAFHIKPYWGKLIYFMDNKAASML